MYITEDKAISAVDKYGDMAYKFAFILTMSDSGAEAAVVSALSYLAAHDLLDADDAKNRKLVLNRVYKAAKKNKAPATSKDEIDAKYGEKSNEFYEIASLSLSERAVEHLTLYEEYTAEEAKNIIRSKIN